jgi:hypothetical protein
MSARRPAAMMQWRPHNGPHQPVEPVRAPKESRKLQGTGSQSVTARGSSGFQPPKGPV